MLKEKTLDINLFPQFDDQGNLIKEIEIPDFSEVSKLFLQIKILNQDEEDFFVEESKEQYLKVYKNLCNFQLELKMQEEPDNINVLALVLDNSNMKYINFNYFDQSGTFTWDGHNNPKVGRIVSLKIKMPAAIIYEGQEIEFSKNNFDKIKIYLTGYYLIDSLEEDGEFKTSDVVILDEEPT